MNQVRDEVSDNERDELKPVSTAHVKCSSISFLTVLVFIDLVVVDVGSHLLPPPSTQHFVRGSFANFLRSAGMLVPL